METKLLYQTLDKVEADAVVVVLFEDDPAPSDLKFAAEWIEGMREPGEFAGKSDEIAVLHQPQTIRAKRLVVGGAGGSVVRVLKQKGVKKLAWWLNGGDAEAVVEGAVLGNYDPDQYKTSNQGKPLEAFYAVAATNGAEIDQAFERGRILGESQNFARDLVNEPANRLTPTVLAD